MSKEALRNRLLGTWQLVGSVIRFEEGDFETSLVRNLPGFLIYTAERRLDCTATQWAGKSAIEKFARCSLHHRRSGSASRIARNSVQRQPTTLSPQPDERKRPDVDIRNIKVETNFKNICGSKIHIRRLTCQAAFATVPLKLWN